MNIDKYIDDQTDTLAVVKGLEYETANRGQDANDKDAERFVDDRATPTSGSPTSAQPAFYITQHAQPRIRREKDGSAV